MFIYKFEAMTTPCELLIYHKDKTVTDAVARLILQEAKRLEKKYNYFDDTSFLSALNSRKIDKIDTETKNLIHRAMLYYSKTDKVFDITIATIKEIFNTENNIEKLYSQKEKLLKFVGCEHIKIKKNRLIFDNPYTKIDLGGFVKEYAVDRAAIIAKKYKISSAIINFGGDIFAIGKKPNGQKFEIGIKNPLDPTKFIRSVSIENQALTTSASYERNVKIEGSIFSHIISKEEYSDEIKPNSVTVISDNCVESGVFSTALMIKPSIKTKHRVIML
ncbi:MAG: FAD:protein FMN transferase [Epsilonproteobacteria bacterium]|nr:FAD:protein FMN transferase [Campylobacterota bacterium]